MFLNGIQQGGNLQAVPGGIGTFLLLDSSFIDRPLYRSYDQAGSHLIGKGITVFNGLPEIVPGINMNQGKRKPGGPERLAGQVGHHDGILSSREQESRVLKLGSCFPQHENGFGFELVKVAELIVGHITLW